MERALKEGKAGVVSVMQASLNYLTYFKKTWIPMINSWSRFGRVRAAALAGVEVDKIPTTNNHLEGFNSVLKSSYLARYVLWYYLATSECLRFGVHAACHVEAAQPMNVVALIIPQQ